MDTDPNLMLCLLAVRMLGGRSVPADAPILKKLADSVKRAKEQALLNDVTIIRTVTNKAGKPTRKQIKGVELAAEGERLLRESSDAGALAATHQAHLAALRQTLEADRQSLRQEVLSAHAAKPKSKGDPHKELTELSKAVSAIAKRLEKLEGIVQGGGEHALLAKIDEAFAGLITRLEQCVPAIPPPASATAEVKAPEPVRPPPAVMPEAKPITPEAMRAALRDAYKKLCLFVEFEDGLVEIPPLYDEVHKTLPHLSVETFHRELESLWDHRVLELKILNEVQRAREPEKAIRRDDNLYYYVYWKQP